MLGSLAAICFAASACAQDSFVNFEGKQVQPVRLSPDGSRLFAVNTPDARLSVFDLSDPSNPILIAEIPVGIEPVSVNPLSNDEAWVVNEVSDSVSVVSVSRHMVTDTLYVKDEPADVVFAGGKAFVTAARRNEIHVFDVISHARLAVIPVFGENPRALAATADGLKVFAAFALSGNRTTIIPPEEAPPQPTPTNPALPPPPQVSLIVDATDSAWSSVIRYTMPDNDVVEIDAQSLTVSRYFSRVGTVNLGIAVRPGTDEPYVANTDARNLVRFEPNVRGHIVENRISRISPAAGEIAHFDLNPGIDYDLLPNHAAQSNALAQPTGIAFAEDGNTLFVAAFGTDRIAKLDADGNVLARIDVGPATGAEAEPRRKRGPRGLALGSADRLYVLNRIANTLSVVDTTNNAVLREIPAGSYDPTPAAIREGRGFLYDAKLSGNGTASCAACHVDAEMDMLAWDLGDPDGQMQNNRVQLTVFLPSAPSSFHPMKGPMTTQTLRGLRGLEPFHWRGDRTNFLHFNGAFPSLMGGDLLSDADMRAYRDFIHTIVFQPNPNQNLDRTLPTSFRGANAAAGRNTFFNEQYQPGLSCTTCHTGPPGPGSDRLINPRQALQESQDFKVPQLRATYQKMNFNSAPGAESVGGFGFVHDGIDSTIFGFLSRPVFGVFANDTVRKRNLEAFVQCFDTGMAPAVGYARTVTSSNVAAADLESDWLLLENQAAAGNIDLIARGTVDGKLRGLLYRPAPGNYRSDRTGAGPFSKAQLRASIQAGDTLTIMGVPPGSGERMGIDRNQDGLLDGDVPAPLLTIERRSASAVISWPTNASGFVLENTRALPPSHWVPDTSQRGISGNRFSVTNSLSSSNAFFRLRGL